MLVALFAAGAIAAFTRAPFWLAFGIAVVALFVNGWVATLEDDISGGLNNPDGTETPPYVIRTGWIIRSVGVPFALACVGVFALHYFSER